MRSASSAVLLSFVLCGTASTTTSQIPEQLHLSYSDDPTSMTISWSTPAPADSSITIHEGSDVWTVKGTSEKFVQRINSTLCDRVDILKCLKAAIDCPRCVSEHLHTVTVPKLSPGSRYTYQVHGDSRNFTFTAKNTSVDWSPTLAVFGDLGSAIPGGDVSPSLKLLMQETANNAIDAVLHVGDFAYNFWDDGGQVGDAFMRQIEPIAARVPYMATPGNHEGGTNFAGDLMHYVHRFNMPNKRESSNNYYSFDMGPAHIVSFSSEAYFWQLWEVEKQFAWLKNDLSAVDRAKTPWLITMAHRPMYCSNSDHDDCTKDDSIMRTGLPFHGMRFFKLEELFQQHKVDLSLWAHEHSYERTWPVFNSTVLNGTSHPGQPYHNPRATVHIVTGSAGCREGIDEYDHGGRGPWSAVRNSEYGYGKLQIANSTHLHWEQIEDRKGAVVDSLWLVKDMDRDAPLTASDAISQEDLQWRILEKTAPCMAKERRLPECALAGVV